MTTPKRTSQGRQKIAMEPIVKQTSRQVCFSKRRGGLFKKASELSVICGSEVAIVAFSPAGRVFSFGHPSAGSVIDRFLTDDRSSNSSSSSSNLSSVGGGGRLDREYAELQEMTEAAAKRSDVLKEELRAKQTAFDADMETMGLTELVEFERALVELRRSLADQRSQYAAPPPVALPLGNVGGAADIGFGVKNDDKDVRLPPLPPSLDGFDYGRHRAFFGAV